MTLDACLKKKSPCQIALYRQKLNFHTNIRFVIIILDSKNIHLEPPPPKIILYYDETKL